MIQTVHCVDTLTGGVASVLFAFAKACSGISFNFISVAPVDNASKRAIELAGGRLIAEDLSSSSALAGAIAAARDDYGADIFHVHRNWHNLRPCMFAKNAGYPVVISHSHNVFPSTSVLKDVYHFAFKRIIKIYADCCWGCSPEAIDFLYGHSPKNPLFVPNPVSFDRFRYSQIARDEIREKMGLGDCFVLIHSGLPIPQKNHRFLLRIFAGIKDEDPNAKLLLLGPSADRNPDLVGLAEELGVRDSVIFCGYVDNPELYYSAADLFLFPSINEGLSLALCEAQAEGLGFIAADTITRSSDLFGNGVFLPIDKGIDRWVEVALSKRCVRNNPSSSAIASCPFNVNYSAPLLESTYRGLLEGTPWASLAALWGGDAECSSSC